MTDTHTDKLDRIEQKLDQLLAEAEAFKAAIGPVLANPGKLLAKMMSGGR